MAVKQNNTEGNGTPPNVNGNATGTSATGGTMSGASVGVGVGGTGGGSGGSKTKMMNPQHDVGGNSNGDSVEPGCSGVNIGSNISPKSKGTLAGGVDGNSAEEGNTAGQANKGTDIAQILQVIELVEMKNIVFSQEIVKIYHHLILELARVQMPRQVPEEMKIFKEDMLKVGAFFSKPNEKRIYLFYLRVVCQLIAQDDGDPPSCAIAIIFQLFSSDMIFEAVQSLLEHNVPDQNIRKTVRLLCEWLRQVNFCQNLSLWIIAILMGLQNQKKYALFVDIAMDNIEPLFATLIMPAFRSKAGPIVYHMLSSVDRTPSVFHKILPKYPRIINYLKQQSNSRDDYADDTKKFLQKLVDLTKVLMVRFYGYDDLYEAVELIIKDIPPSYSSYFNNGSNAKDGTMGVDALSHDNNAKVGLVNLGNTCYMNSVLQALAMTKEFSREILLSQSKSPLLIKMQQQIALMLYSTRYELIPSRILNATRPPGFSAGLQQDSSEYLGHLLETLHEQEATSHQSNAVAINKFSTKVDVNTETTAEAEAAEPIAKTAKQAANGISDTAIGEGASGFHSPTQNGAVSNTDILPNSGCNDYANNVAAPTINTLDADKPNNTEPTVLTTIEKTFTGKLATTYECLTCGLKSRIVDSFRDLQLSFPEVKNDCASNYSVQDLIDYYCSPEKLDGDNQYFCERCKKLCDAERYINVISAPKNLILTLKHFKYDQKYHTRAKLMHKVFHDEKVSVKVCSTETMDEIASVHYDLYAGVVHSGFSMDSGHYYTYASDITNKWYKFNDNIVTPSKSEELHNLTPPNTPYILFYQMGARSNEASTEASNKVVKVDVPSPLILDELPPQLRDYVDHDNYLFTEEEKGRIFKNNSSSFQGAMSSKRSGTGRGDGRSDDDNDSDQPPPGSGCGGNALDVNVNRFVY